jgi:hypothetical protein
MFGNETKRPHHATFAKMASAMGYEYALTRELKPVYENEVPKARAEYKAYQAELKKKRERSNRRKNGGGK